jgi:hypothetical protein
MDITFETNLDDPDIKIEITISSAQQELSSLENVANAMFEFIHRVSKYGINKNDARQLTLLNHQARLPALESFTELPTRTNLKPALEAATDSIKELIESIVAKAKELFKRFAEWITDLVTRRNKTASDIKVYYTKFLETEKVKQALKPMVVYEVSESIAESETMQKLTGKLEFSYNELVEHLIKDQKYADAALDIYRVKSHILGILKTVIQHYERLLANPEKLLESVSFDPLNPSMEIYGMQNEIDSILNKVNNILDRFDVSFSRKDENERSTQYTAILAGRVLAELREMYKRPANSTNNLIDENARRLQKLNLIADRMENANNGSFENQVKDLLREVDRMVSAEVRLPADLEPDTKKHLYKQVVMHRQVMVDLLQITTKLESLSNYVLSTILEHVKAVAMFELQQQRATAVAMRPEIRKRQDNNLNAQLEKLFNNPI